MKPQYCYSNGKIIPVHNAQISINDIGLLRGYAVFDFLRSHNSKPLLLDKHLKRFANSAKKLNLRIPLTNHQIESLILKLIQKNNLPDAGIRLFLSGGESPDGTHFDSKTPTFFVTAASLPIHAPEIYQKGVKLITHEYLRTKPEAKSTNYLTMLSRKS
ncbi:MAG: aminotransferase class IV [bacterium]|nr:aminotransferase class IV [bacterium]